VWAVAVFVVTIVVAMAWRWTVGPATTPVDAVEPADAVVLFVGGRGERLTTARELLERGVADVLVIPNGYGPDWPEADEICRAATDLEIICPVPEPNNTRGEAHAIATLAAERGWDRLVVVTSTYHVARARLMLERCFDGEVVAVGADPDLSFGDWLSRVNHEWFGHLHARTISRRC
jgi:uncharacterized SAM-binding protein YcdF (DUF218 family)